MIRENWRRLTVGRRIIWQAPEWPRVAGPDWADRIMQVEVTDRLHVKQGRSIARWTLTQNGKQTVVFLKRHYRLPGLSGWLAAFFHWREWSPAGQEWHHLQWVAQAGVPVPRALAAGEFVGPWGRLRSFIAIQELDDMLPLHEAIPLACRKLSPRAFQEWKAGLIAEMVRLVRRLHDRHRFHQDLYLCHFYLARLHIENSVANWNGKLFLIDFHRLTHRRFTAIFGRVKDLAQLLYSTRVEGVTARDCLRFWRQYWAGRSRHWLRLAVLWKSRRYESHNRKRRSLLAHAPIGRTALEHRALL
jgi:heptose I phosphotransferase